MHNRKCTFLVDDFVIFAKTKEILEELVKTIKEYFDIVGWKINADKEKWINMADDHEFEYLGYRFRKSGDKLYISFRETRLRGGYCRLATRLSDLIFKALIGVPVFCVDLMEFEKNSFYSKLEQDYEKYIKGLVGFDTSEASRQCEEYKKRVSEIFENGITLFQEEFKDENNNSDYENEYKEGIRREPKEIKRKFESVLERWLLYSKKKKEKELKIYKDASYQKEKKYIGYGMLIEFPDGTRKGYYMKPDIEEEKDIEKPNEAEIAALKHAVDFVVDYLKGKNLENYRIIFYTDNLHNRRMLCVRDISKSSSKYIQKKIDEIKKKVIVRLCTHGADVAFLYIPREKMELPDLYASWAEDIKEKDRGKWIEVPQKKS